MKVKQNIARLKYLIGLYRLSADELCNMISDGLKNPITKNEIFLPEIKVSHLKKIDKVFNKGLHFYLDPKVPETSKEASIFFRKGSFNAELNIGAKKIVNHFEELKISLSALSKLAEINIKRVFPVYELSDNPILVAKAIRKQLYPSFTSNLKDFLTSLISKFAEHNILVFEFVETWNKKEKANIDGFFLNPNVIVLKRQQTSFRREIFTLIHELGHLLLNEEEIEKFDYQNLAKTNLSSIEKWCNDFSFSFLAGEHSVLLDKIDDADPQNDYHFELIRRISESTHLSQIALFTRLLFQDKISRKNYNKIKTGFDEQFIARQKEQKRLRESERERGIKQRGSAPQPIKSPLLISTVQTAFYEGVLNEYEVCMKLNIKPEKLDKYIQ